MELNCTYHFAKEKETQITVGDVFEAHCQLPQGATPEVSKLAVKQLDPAHKNYDLVMVKAAIGGDHLGLALTSYLVGPKDLKDVVITDGTTEWTLTPPVQFEVKSILKQDQKPEMFGPMSVTIPIPIFYWLVLAFAILLSVVSSIVAFYFRQKRKKLMKRLETLEDGSQPIQQFFATYRKLQRENLVFSSRSVISDEDGAEPKQNAEELLKMIKTVETALRIFVARRFRISSFEFSWRAIHNEMEKYHDLVASVMGSELLDLGREFSKVGVGRNRLSPKDALSISEKTRKWIEKADQLQTAVVNKDSQQIKKIRGAK